MSSNTTEENTISNDKSNVDTKLMFEMYSQEIKTINDLFIEKFNHSESYEDDIYKQLILMDEYMKNYEKYLKEKLTHLKEEIVKFSNYITSSTSSSTLLSNETK